MNATQTLGAIIGIHALEHKLDAHVLNILLHKVAAMRNARKYSDILVEQAK